MIEIGKCSILFVYELLIKIWSKKCMLILAWNVDREIISSTTLDVQIPLSSKVAEMMLMSLQKQRLLRIGCTQSQPFSCQSCYDMNGLSKMH